jgi:hypothetical protein
MHSGRGTWLRGMECACLGQLAGQVVRDKVLAKGGLQGGDAGGVHGDREAARWAGLLLGWGRHHERQHLGGRHRRSALAWHAVWRGAGGLRTPQQASGGAVIPAAGV